MALLKNNTLASCLLFDQPKFSFVNINQNSGGTRSRRSRRWSGRRPTWPSKSSLQRKPNTWIRDTFWCWSFACCPKNVAPVYTVNLIWRRRGCGSCLLLSSSSSFPSFACVTFLVPLFLLWQRPRSVLVHLFRIRLCPRSIARDVVICGKERPRPPEDGLLHVDLEPRHPGRQKGRG